MGGYHQVPSTTHLDSLLVCKARGAGLRQVVLLRPCGVLHQNHPAPVASMRYTLPAWHLTPLLCAQKEQETRDWALAHPLAPSSSRGADVCDAPSMDDSWGFPEEVVVEHRGIAACPADWQWWSLDLSSHDLSHDSSHVTNHVASHDPSHDHSQDPSHDPSYDPSHDLSYNSSRVVSRDMSHVCSHEELGAHAARGAEMRDDTPTQDKGI